MKRMLIFLSVFFLATTFPLRAQDAALLEERVKQLKAIVDDLNEDKANQRKQIETLAKEVQALREHQQNQPSTAYASQEDLRELAKKVQEIEEKRKADREFIVKQIENLGKTPAGGKTRSPRASTADPRPADPSARTDLPTQAIEHTIASGDTFSTIAAAYSKEKGVKITTEQIRKANPGVKDDKLKIGQKIFVPLPEK